MLKEVSSYIKCLIIPLKKRWHDFPVRIKAMKSSVFHMKRSSQLDHEIDVVGHKQ